MKAYLKAKKYLEVYIVADNTLVSTGKMFSHFASYRWALQISPASYCDRSAPLRLTTDLG